MSYRRKFQVSKKGIQRYNAALMSYLAEQDVLCPHCKHPNTGEVWSSINVQEDPELKDILLGGELNLIECAACKKVFFAEQFLLYHDPASELMAFVYPFSYRDEKEAWEEKTRMDFSQSNFSYPAVTLFGLDELVRLVEGEEEAAIQGEIVNHLASDNRLSVRKLRPSVARHHKVPPVIPFVGNEHKPGREQILSALSRIQELNDRLTVYSSLYSTIQNNPAMNFDFAE